MKVKIFPKICLKMPRSDARACDIFKSARASQIWCIDLALFLPPGYMKRFRYCNYLGKYFCSSCHHNSLMVIPARIIRKWDFRKYPFLSTFAEDRPCSNYFVIINSLKPNSWWNRSRNARFFTLLWLLSHLRLAIVLRLLSMAACYHVMAKLLVECPTGSLMSLDFIMRLILPPYGIFLDRASFRYEVSKFSMDLLNKIYRDPLFNIKDLNFSLYSKVHQLETIKVIWRPN